MRPAARKNTNASNIIDKDNNAAQSEVLSGVGFCVAKSTRFTRGFLFYK